MTAVLFLLFSCTRISWGAPQQAIDKPSTDVLAAYEVTLASGKTISLVNSLGEGGEPAQLELEGGKILAVGLSLESSADQVVAFRLLEGRRVGPTDLAWKQVEKFSLRPGATYTTAWKPTLAFRLKGLKPAPAPERQGLKGAASDHLISYEVTTASKKGIKLVGRAGDMALIESTDYRLGVVPELRVKDSAGFRVYTFHTVDGGKEIPEEVENFTLLLGDARVLKVQPTVTLRLTSIKQQG